MKENPIQPRLQKSVMFFLYAFALTSVASIAMQNFIWVSVALFLYFHFKERRRIDWPRGPFPLATLLFLASFFLGALLGTDPANSFRTVHKYLTMLMIFPLGAMAIRLDQIRKLLLYFIYGAAICALVGVFYKHYYLHQERIDSFSGDKMVFGGMLMVSLLLVLFFLSEEPGSFLLWSLAPILGLALIFTQTRGAWIGFLAGFMVLAWRLRPKWLLGGMLLMVISYFFMSPPLQERVRSIGNLDISYNRMHQVQDSSQTRLLIWISGWHMIQDHPWGVGQGNVEKLFPQYKLQAFDEPTVPHLHDDFLQLLAQNGWQGLALYLSWLLSYYGTALRSRPKNPGLQGLHWSFLSAFTAVWVWGLTEYTFSQQFMSVQFFLLGLQTNLWRAGNALTDRKE